LLVGASQTPARAATIRVPDDYASIQAAIDAAVDGDEIVVAAGTYKEAIDFKGKAVHLHSLDGPETTIINATGLQATVVKCASGEGSGTVLEGFTVTGGYFGGMNNNASSPTVINCRFRGNTCYNFGGGMRNDRSSPIVTGCTFSGNSATFGDEGHEGGGMYNHRSSPTITGCTFVGNTAALGGGIYNSSLVDDNVVTVSNCILWGDPHEISIYGGNAVVRFSDVQGGFDGDGNIDVDPRFVRNPSDGGDGWGDDPETPDFDESSNDDFGDLRLTADSPCIDAGDPAFDPPPGERDLDGHKRLWDGDDDGTAIVDMGAYEFGSHAYGDLDCSGGVDFNDIDPFVTALISRDDYESQYPDCNWLNGDIDENGAVDFNDIDAFVECLINGGCE
jgi:hypothetical protein